MQTQIKSLENPLVNIGVNASRSCVSLNLFSLSQFTVKVVSVVIPCVCVIAHVVESTKEYFVLSGYVKIDIGQATCRAGGVDRSFKPFGRASPLVTIPVLSRRTNALYSYEDFIDSGIVISGEAPVLPIHTIVTANGELLSFGAVPGGSATGVGGKDMTFGIR